MGNELVPARKAGLPAPGFERTVVETFMEGRNANTMDAYRFDLTDFAKWVGASGPGAAVELLIAAGQGRANETVLGYKAELVERKLAPTTINRRLAALRSMLRLARQLARITWSLDVAGIRVTPYRDTRGPGENDRDDLVIRAQRRAKASDCGKRDLALVMLMDNPALRRAECIALDLEDVRLEECQVQVIGKGKTEPEWLSIPRPTRDALRDWITVRGGGPGPLFVRLDPGSSGGLDRLSLGSVNRMMDRLSAKAGLRRKVRPHGLRHGCITRILETTDGNVRIAQRIGRHAKLETLMRYDDNRRDDAGDAAQRLADVDAARVDARRRTASWREGLEADVAFAAKRGASS